MTYRCPACGFVVTVLPTVLGSLIITTHDDRLRMVCRGSGMRVIVDVVDSL